MLVGVDGPHRPFLNPFFSFSARKKRTVSIFQEKKEGLAKSGVHPAPPSCDNSLNWLYLPALTHLSAGNYAPHAILMMAVISLPTNTVKAKTSIRRKSRARLWSIEGVRGNHPKGFPGLFSFARRFLFGEAKRKCRPLPLFPKRGGITGLKNLFSF